MKKHGIKVGKLFNFKRAAGANKLLGMVKKSFPDIKYVCDAKQAVGVNVSKSDNELAVQNAPDKCAMAIAACRTFKSKRAFIGMNDSCLVFEDTVVRFKTPASVSREIVSFDRHHDFAKGSYRLSPMTPSHALGRKWKNHAKKNKSKLKRNITKKVPRHVTLHVRAL
jgi:hypothetical protein